MELPYKDKEVKKAKARDYHAKNKKKINDRHRKRYSEKSPSEKQAEAKSNYQNNKEKESQRKKEYRQKVKDLFQKKCLSCETTETLLFHEIHWKKHPINLSYYIKHKEDFITLCNVCHRGFHFLHQKCNMELEDILKLIRKIQK